MKMIKKLKFMVAAVTFAAFTPSFAADGVKVAEVNDFQAVGERAEARRLPIMLMFSADHCGYCTQVEEDYLKPMLRSGDYADRALIRKVKIDGYDKIRDFDGKMISTAEFAERYDVFVTPTVIFISGDGVEVGEKRVGLMTRDYYWAYLDSSIDQALNILRRDKPMRVKLSAIKE